MKEPRREKESVLVLDYGSQYNQLICRRIRELGVYSELLPHDVAFEKIADLHPKAVILSGSPSSVYDRAAPKLPAWLLTKQLPVLGICYGMQLLSKRLGGKVQEAESREYGPAGIRLTHRSPLFQGVKTGSLCWMSHADEVTKIPSGFQILARSSTGSLAAIGDSSRRIYGVQFHPEVSHTPFGTQLLRNFLAMAGCSFTWNLSSFLEDSIPKIRKEVGNKGAICAVSGGVDSTVAALMVARAIGNQLHAVFVDHGLLREKEREEVEAIFSRLPLTFHAINAKELFLKRLRHVADPEEKRKIIGNAFVELFERKAESLGKIEFLVQGTLYPDVIESSSGANKLSVKIKTHHNVGGLPEAMNLKIIEPLRYLFKDEARKIGKKLGLPKGMIDRQPFPGPGLAVRILGSVEEKTLSILRKADAIVQDEIGKYKGKKDLWQYFPVLLPIKTVGVMGDGRTYQRVIALRVVHSQDGMTADWARLPWELLSKTSSRIVSEVRGVNRVVYDITPKPPATIEWE